MKYDAIVVASGLGKRSELDINKVLFVMKNGKTVLENSCNLFLEDEDCQKLIIVCNDEIGFSNSKIEVVPGGQERYNSVANGLSKVTSEIVLIHDGARPYLTKSDLEKIKDEITRCDGAILAYKESDTVKYVVDGIIKETIDRDKIYHALTPQAFKTSLIKDAYNTIPLNKITDDASLLEKMNLQVRIVEGEKTNIKLTFKEDFQ